MGRLWRPLLVGAVVVVAVFLLAQRPIFEPEASTNETLPRGAVLYELTRKAKKESLFHRSAPGLA